MIRAVVFDLWNTLVFSPAGSPFQRMKELLRPEQAHHFPALVRDGMVQPYPSVQAFLEAWKEAADLDEAQLEAMALAFLEAGAQAEEQELAALVAADRLQRRIVDDLDRAIERRCEIKSDPALAKIVRFRDRPVAHDRPGVADRT